MAELFAVQGMTLAHATGSQASGGSLTPTTPPSIKVKAESKGVYRGPVAFSFSGGNYVGGQPGTAVGTGTINGSATKNKADSLAVLLEGDSGTMTGTYVSASNPFPTLPFSSDVEVSVAGQTKATGE